jgi:hypothetical protein
MVPACSAMSGPLRAGCSGLLRGQPGHSLRALAGGCGSQVGRVERLNIAEGDFSDPGNGRARFFTAAGSANETLAGAKVAIAWGYLQSPNAASRISLLEHLVRMLWKLARR